MLSVGRHRAVCYLRQGKSVPYTPPPPPPPPPHSWHRGLQASTEGGNRSPLEDVVLMRRRQAQRTLLVEVAGPSSSEELCRVCGQHGRVQALFHYTLPSPGRVKPKEMILVEYSEASAAQEALRHSTHAPSQDSTPSHSPLLWLSAGGGAAPPHHGPTPNLTLTPPVTQEEVLSRLSQCSSISDQIQTFHDSQKLTELGWRLRFFTCGQIESAVSGLFPKAVVLPFGSSVNSFGHRDSDLDMTLELAGDGSAHQNGWSRLVFQSKKSSSSANPRLTLQRRMEVVAELIDHFIPGCSQVRRILNARVPIIKYRQQLTAIDCDLTMSNRSGYHMSRMLHLYGCSDGRVVPLVNAVRQWARCRGLTSPHAGRWLTNFSLTMMVLMYLMNTSPPLLLPLTTLKVTPGVDQETGDSVFTVPADSASLGAITAAANTHSLDSLFRGFFEFFDKFNFRERGMSIVTGRDFVKPQHCALYIQNPLDRDLNVSRNVTLEEVERLKTEVTHARFIMEVDDGSSDTTPGTGNLWGAQRLWWRSGTVAHRPLDYAIDWRAVFHPPKEPAKPKKGSPGEAASEGNTKGKELPGLVSKLKQKAQQKKQQTPRYNRKGKLLH